jgi:hypothetical protein
VGSGKDGDGEYAGRCDEVAGRDGHAAGLFLLGAESLVEVAEAAADPVAAGGDRG